MKGNTQAQTHTRLLIIDFSIDVFFKHLNHLLSSIRMQTQIQMSFIFHSSTKFLAFLEELTF